MRFVAMRFAAMHFAGTIKAMGMARALVVDVAEGYIVRPVSVVAIGRWPLALRFDSCGLGRSSLACSGRGTSSGTDITASRYRILLAASSLYIELLIS